MEKSIGNRAEAGFGSRVVCQDRLAADIARGGDQWRAKILKQQMMQGAVWQHGANFAAVGRDFRRQFIARLLRHQHHGPDRIAQHGLVRGIQHRCAAKCGEVLPQREHDGQRLVRDAACATAG